MALELKIISPSEEGFVKAIVWNHEEIEKAVAEKMSYYHGLVYTDDQIIEAKKDRAALNKFVAALKAKDREIKKLCLQPYDEFHERMLQIIAQVEEPAALIDDQVKGYEEGQKAAKLEEIRKLYESKGFQPWVTLERIMNPSWLNKSYSLKKIEADLSTIQHSIGEDILIINQMGEGQPAALREYQRTLSKTAAVEAGNRYIEARYAEQRLAETIKREQEEAAKQKQAEIDRDLGIAEPVPAPEPVRVAPAQTVSREQPEVKPIAFIAWLNREQFEALNQCIKSNHIKVKQLKKGDDDTWQ
ncbi:MAG: DUF1351 domain-containing protein [Lachnospiraceae bacterium]|nr:DUF1351 domain-containing protein [Lachnospiraceae bacterium]